MNYKTLYFKTLTEYSLQYHTTQVQTKSKQQLQYNYGLGGVETKFQEIKDTKI